MNPYSASTRLVASPGFPQQLIERMEQTGWGTLALADAANVNKETISLWRSGRQPAYTYERVVRVAAVLGTTAEELLDLPAPGSAAAVSQSQQMVQPKEELVRRVAKLGPLIENLSQLEEVIAEARKLAVE